jgi:hypothetical protein
LANVPISSQPATAISMWSELMNLGIIA